MSSEKVRLLRVLEYEFPSLALMEEHVAAMTIPLQGVVQFREMTVRSMALHPHGADQSLFTVVPDDDPEDAPARRVGLLAGSPTQAMRWAHARTDLGDVVILSHPSQVTGLDAVVELASARNGNNLWGPIRSACYSTNIPIHSVQEWENVNQEDIAS